MTIGRKEIKRFKGLCRHVVSVKAGATLYFNSTTFYCGLKTPVKVGKFYTYAGLCNGTHYSSANNGKQDTSIIEERIMTCPDREY